MEERDPILEEVRENFVLKKLQERVWRLESENKDLKVNNELLHTQYTSQRETQSDILRNLHSNIDENYQKIEEQDKTIERLEQQLQAQKQEFEDRLEAEKHQWENRVLGLQKQNDELEEKLANVQKFVNDKEFMEGELDRLKRELEEQAESHTRDVSAFDRKKAIEIDQLKKDMHRKVREMREMLRAKTKDQLDQTTKRAIMENEQMVTELHFQNKESERLLNSNNKLLEENAQLRRNLAIHKDLENELARRTHVYQKLIKKMDQRQKAELSAKDQSRELRMSDTLNDDETSHFDVSRELPSAVLPSEETGKLKKQVEQVNNTLAMVRHEFAQYRRDHATLTQLQDQSTRLIISALYELKNQRECDPFPPASYDENADWQFANMTVKQKEYFFRMLLEKLNSSMCGSCFPVGAPAPANAGQSVTSLPSIHKTPQHEEASHGQFSQFLWSVATHGVQPSVHGHAHSSADMVTKSVQTETSQSDPCLKEGLWNPTTRKGYSDSGAVTPSMVTGGVRPWGPRSVTHRRR
mmetsp:Transcript_64254/g.186280  ORF Transcript_64254/g.186280 Transcript_64254/m.186280 type:complete len:526 (+) Transcript_64254:118-1695(+)